MSVPKLFNIDNFQCYLAKDIFNYDRINKMGNCNFKSANQNEAELPKLKVENFTRLYAIGRGGFGKVWRVESKKEKE